MNRSAWLKINDGNPMELWDAVVTKGLFNWNYCLVLNKRRLFLKILLVIKNALVMKIVVAIIMAVILITMFIQVLGTVNLSNNEGIAALIGSMIGLMLLGYLGYRLLRKMK